MGRYLSLLWVGVAALVGGCSLAPKYVRPAAPVPTAWPTGTGASDTPAGTAVPGASQLRWPQFITDAKLQQVVGAALTNNRDLRLAALNVERAQALYGIKRAELLPVFEARGTGSRQRQPADLSATGERATVQQYGVNLGVMSWELDFFGRIRSLKRRALEEYLATEQARRSAEILLVSAVADAYLSAAAARESLHLSESTLVAQRGAYELVKRRFDGGLVPELDLYRAQTQVDIARGDVARLSQRVAQSDHALQLLVGAPVSEELLPTTLDNVAPPGEFSAGVPSEVLLQRPDVLQSEALLRAAEADIGAARAAFFPRISLTAAAGTASSELSGLFGSGSDTWSYAPQIVLPIFDARTWSAHRAARVQREMAVTQYERTVQVAFREVADALAQRGTVGEQVAAQQSLVEATAATYRLAEARYLRGIDSYLTVLDAQRSLYGAQQGLISLRLARLASSLTLYKVLGGG